MSEAKAPNTPKQQGQKQGGQGTPGGQQKKPQTPADKQQNKGPNTPKQQGGDNKQQQQQNKAPNTPKQQGGENKQQQQNKAPNTPKQQGGDNKQENKPQQNQQQKQKGGDNKPQQNQQNQNKQQNQQQKGGDNKQQQNQQKQKGGDNKQGNQQVVKAEQNGAKKVKPTKAEDQIVPAADLDLDDDFPTSSFWAVEVEPKKAFTQNLVFPVKIKQAVLGQKAGGDDKEPNILYAVVESKKWPIAVLSSAIPQQTLNLSFDAQTSLTFLSSGSASIFVYGNYYPNEDFDDDDDEDGYPEYDDYDSEDDEDEDDEDEDEEEEDSDDEISEKIAQAALKRKANAPSGQNQQQQKKPKQNEPEEQPKAKQPEPQKNNQSADGYQTLKNGLKFQDLTKGTGSKPTPGKQVTVGYVGRLTSGKVFDRSNSFSFRLGIGEVIKGWDLGVATMQVGTKRRLVIPPQLGYGPRGAPPDIPGNATLIFDIELKKV